MKKLPLLLATFLAIPCIARSEADDKDTLSEPISQLQKMGQDFAQAAQLSQSIGGPKSGDLRALADEYRDFSNNFSSLSSYVQNGNYDEAISTIRRWMARTRNAQVKQSLASLLEALQAQRKKQVEKLTAATDEKMAKIAALLAKATTPDEVESIRLDLEDFRNESLNRGGRDLQRVSAKVSRASNFLENWRQYLTAQNDGEIDQALNYLANIRQNGGTMGLIPQKELSDRYVALLEKQLSKADTPDPESPMSKAAASVMAQVKTGKNAEAAADKFSRMIRVASRGSATDYPLINSLNNQLRYVARLQGLLDQKSYQQVVESTYPWTYPEQPSPYYRTLEAIIADQKLAAITARYQLANIGKPKNGECLCDFLRAKSEEAYASKDWAGLYQRLQALSAMGGGNFQQGVRAYIAGSQLEKAGLYREALRQYAACIEQTGPFVPGEEATAAAGRILKEHPDAQSASKE